MSFHNDALTVSQFFPRFHVMLEKYTSYLAQKQGDVRHFRLFGRFLNSAQFFEMFLLQSRFNLFD